VSPKKVSRVAEAHAMEDNARLRAEVARLTAEVEAHRAQSRREEQWKLEAYAERDALARAIELLGAEQDEAVSVLSHVLARMDALDEADTEEGIYIAHLPEEQPAIARARALAATVESEPEPRHVQQIETRGDWYKAPSAHAAAESEEE
jgi:hypothetical protein